MTDALARQAGLLAGVLVLLLRGGAFLAPPTLALAGAVALMAYGLLALTPPLWRRLAAVRPPAADLASPPDA